jgi:hypothetical protein
MIRVTPWPFIFDPVFENRFWRIRYKNGLYELFSEPDIVKIIKVE